MTTRSPMAHSPQHEFWRAMAISRSLLAVAFEHRRSLAEAPKAQRPTMKRISTPSRYAVQAAIAASLRQGGATLPRAARQLGISRRSLQRRIAEMGTSYSELVAEVRIDTACHLLAESDERIADIAARL